MNLARSLGSVGGLTLASRMLGARPRHAVRAVRRRQLRVRRLRGRLAHAQHVPGAVRRGRVLGGVHPDVQPARSPTRTAPDCPPAFDFAEDALSVLLPVLVAHDGAARAARLARDLPASRLGFNGASHEQFAFAVMLAALHLPLPDADLARLAAGRHPQFAPQVLGRRRGADPAQCRADRRARLLPHARAAEHHAVTRRSRSRSAARCSSPGCCRPAGRADVRLKLKRPTHQRRREAADEADRPCCRGGRRGSVQPPRLDRACGGTACRTVRSRTSIMPTG